MTDRNTNIAVGATIRLTKDNPDGARGLYAGAKGTVLAVDGEDGRFGFLAEFDEWSHGHGGFSVTGKDGLSCWWLFPEDFEVVTSEAPAPKTTLAPQTQKLLTILEAGRSVTRVTAMHYGIMNLTARIADLRNAGFTVVCTTKRDVDGNRYGEFSLAA
jgi:hypothetical protein